MKKKVLSIAVLFLSLIGHTLAANKKPYSFAGVRDLKFIRKERLLPRGSALLTSSGKLQDKGIKAIIHAATGSMTKEGGVYNPNAESIKNSIINSLILARRFSHSRVAIPFLAGGIFASRAGLTKDQLARLIVETVISKKKGLEIVFVLFTEEEKKLFENYVPKTKHSSAMVLQGSITDYDLHKASAIVNAANMEVTFGGGISGAIGKASGQSEKIDAEAKAIINSI